MKDIKGYEGRYAITKNGRIWSYDRNKWMSPHKFKNKIWYYSISFQINKKIKSFKIHRLVAQAYIPNPLNLPQVNHKNGVKNDNRVKNLEWCSAKENHQHAHKNGLYPEMPKGEDGYMTKFTNKLILKIRKEYAVKNGLAKKCHLISYRKLAKKYGMGKSNVEAIITRLSWKHI